MVTPFRSAAVVAVAALALLLGTPAGGAEDDRRPASTTTTTTATPTTPTTTEPPATGTTNPSTTPTTTERPTTGTANPSTTAPPAPDEGGSVAAEETDPDTGGGSLPVTDAPGDVPTEPDDATVLGTSVERPVAQAEAELHQSARAEAKDGDGAPRSAPARRGTRSFLPSTGADAAALVLTGAALVALGTVLTRTARRRRQKN